MVKAPHFHCGGKGLIPGQGTKILHAIWNGQKQKKPKKSILNISSMDCYLSWYQLQKIKSIPLRVPMLCYAKSLQSCPTLCDPIDGSSPGSPVPGILQARTLEWVAISFSNAWKWKVRVKSLSRVPTLSDLKDWSLPGSSVHGIFQERGREWGAMAFSIRVPNFL